MNLSHYTICKTLCFFFVIFQKTSFFMQCKYDTDKSDLEKKISDADKKIPDTSRL